jgi:hypothetical protein
MTATEKLVSLGSESLGEALGSLPTLFGNYACGRELFEMLALKNGFYAFEQALHIFPFGSDVTGTMTLEDWNSCTLWRKAYDDLTEGLLFFGEDIFGDQFCISDKRAGVFRFDAERGEPTDMAISIDAWSNQVLSDYRVETGWPLAHEWQKENGPLALGTRLQPKIPFVYGGDYAADNLWAGNSVEGMLFKAEVALKIRNLPAGTQIVLKVKERDGD